MFARFKDFELKPCGETNGKHHLFELVKWRCDGGREWCYVVAWVDWNKREPCWEFASVGTRFLMDYENGLCEYVMGCLNLLERIADYMEQEG